MENYFLWVSGDDGFFVGEDSAKRRGLIPSNFVREINLQQR